MKVTTLVIIHDDENILLALKKRGFGMGRWNGYGGKVHDGETLEKAAIRELEEESGLVSSEIVNRGKIIFKFQDENHDPIEVNFFDNVPSYSGELRETDEMKPQWFSHSEIPYDEMWSDDRLWIPHFLEGKNIRGEVLFDSPDANNIISHTIEGY